MKRLFCLILCMVLALSLAACGPAPSGPTETAANPFTQGTTAAPESSASPSQASVSTTAPSNDPVEGPTFPDGYKAPKEAAIGLHVHPENFPHMEDDPDPRDYYYSGGEIQIPVTLTVESYEYSGVGLIAFLDGIPQPFHLNEGEDDQYINVLYLPDGNHDYTVSFLPVTGTVGQWSELWIGFVLNPELVIPNLDFVWYERRACDMFIFIHINFLTEPEYPTVPSIESRQISQTVSYEPVSYAESIVLPEDQRDLQNCAYYSVDGQRVITTGTTDRRYSASAENPVTVQLKVYGLPDINYRLVFYYDNLPITLDPMEIIDYQDGEKAIVETTVDLTGFDGYARLSAYLVPLNYGRNADGSMTRGGAISCECAVDVVLTSAEDVHELYG